MKPRRESSHHGFVATESFPQFTRGRRFESHVHALPVNTPPTDEISVTATSNTWVLENLRPHEAAVRCYLQTRFPTLDADDVVQESYLKVLRSRASGRIKSAKNYFFSVARNTALTLFRRRQIYAGVAVNELPDWRVIEDAPNGADSANVRLQFDLAIEAMDTLPGRCREIMLLAALAGLAPAEIAARLGIAESTVHVQMARGVRKCADYLRERGERS